MRDADPVVRREDLADARVLEGDLDGDVAVGYHRDWRLAGVVLIGLPGRYLHYRSLVAAYSVPGGPV